MELDLDLVSLYIPSWTILLELREMTHYLVSYLIQTQFFRKHLLDPNFWKFGFLEFRGNMAYKNKFQKFFEGGGFKS